MSYGFLQSLIDHYMSLVPTLKVFRTTVTNNLAYINPTYAEVREFHTISGDLIFGTEVGYMTECSTLDQFTALALSGLIPLDILRMLTTSAAARFHLEDDKGRVIPANSPSHSGRLGAHGHDPHSPRRSL